MPKQGHTPSQTATAPARRDNWVHRHPRWTLLGMNVIGLLLVLIVAEVALRAWGFRAGSLEMGWKNFQPLQDGEPLQVYDHFYTDAQGIFKSTQTAMEERGVTVNADGFRGPEFAPADSSRVKVMLIGDSFVWGASATPIDSCFADLLRRPDWQVMNLGIPGAGPDQYARIAEHYVPRLQPDVVCLFYYRGNDQMRFPIEVAPHQQRWHVTNVGWLDPFGDGEYTGDAQATYDYCAQRFVVPQTTLLNRICAQTVIGTFVWRGLVRLQWIKENYPAQIQAKLDAAKAIVAKGPYEKSYFQRVRAACAAAHVPLKVFLIPLHNDVSPPTATEVANFEGMELIFPASLAMDDYNPRPDCHLNNAGHRKLARHVAAEITRLFPSQP